MPARPTRKIYPTAKLTADNAGDLELTTHRRAVASASAALTAPPQAPPSYLSPLPESSPPPPTDTDEATDFLQVQAVQTLSKRRSDVMSSTLSLESVIIVSPTTSDGDAIEAPVSKKAKTSPSSGQDLSHAPGPPADGSIIDINDIDDPGSEQLNKSSPTADIKYFFSVVPRVDGQTKRQMKCNLCAYVILFPSIIFPQLILMVYQPRSRLSKAGQISYWGTFNTSASRSLNPLGKLQVFIYLSIP